MLKEYFLTTYLKQTFFLNEHTFILTYTHNLEVFFDVLYHKRFIHTCATTHTKHLKCTMPFFDTHTHTLSYSHRKREYLTSHFKPSIFQRPFFRFQKILNRLINKDYRLLFSLFCDNKFLSPSLYQQMP